MPEKFTFTAGPSLPEIAEEVSSELAFITRSISALLIELGFPDNLEVVENVRHEWEEEKLLPNSATVDGTFTPVDTVITVDAGQGENFVVGDAIQVEGSREIMAVTAVAANTVTVTRGTRGTTAIAIADNSLLKRINNPAIENETAPTARSTTRTRVANYTEIFRDVAAVTRSMSKVRLLAGIDDELDHQVENTKRDLIRNFASSVVSGKAQTTNPEGTTTQARTMNGIIHSILGGANPSVIDAGGVGLSEQIMNQLLQDMWTKGGNPRLICAPPTQRRRLSALLEGRQRYRVEDSTLGAVVERFVSDFGELDVLAPDIFIPADVIIVLDTAKIRAVKLGQDGDPFEVIPLGDTGLTFRREVVGEFGLEIMNAGDGGHGLITNLLVDFVANP